MDTICLRPFDFPEEYVFSSEMDRGLEVITSGIIKAPAGSDAMAYAWDVCQSKQPEQLVWGETGPKLMGEAVRKFSLEQYKKSYNVFCPLGYSEWRRILESGVETIPEEGGYAIHLWNEMWRAAGQDKNVAYPEDCLYEKLKRKYLRDGLSAARPRLGR